LSASEIPAVGIRADLFQKHKSAAVCKLLDYHSFKTFEDLMTSGGGGGDERNKCITKGNKELNNNNNNNNNNKFI
jgi:hypothetical protein